MSTHYKIVFKAIAADTDKNKAIAAFAQLFKLPIETAQKALSKPTTLKKDIPADKAKVFKAHLNKIGVLVDIKPVVEAPKTNPFKTNLDEQEKQLQKEIEAEKTQPSAAKVKNQAQQAAASAASNSAIPNTGGLASSGLSLIEDPQEETKSETQTNQNSQTGASSGSPNTATKTENTQGSTQHSTQDKDALVYDDPITHTFEFKGNGLEYFKIWIVNILLTIITLGIYSAWAKVRDNRYFYANTFLDEQNFEYHAQPKQILIGRIILVAIVLLLGFLGALSPVIAILIGLLWAIALPFFIHQGIRFKLAYSSYRNVRFHFQKNIQDSYISYLALPVASSFTLYLLYPFAIFKQRKFLIDNSNFGTSQFSADFTAGEVYKICIITVIGFIVSFVIASALFSATLASGSIGFGTVITAAIFLLIPAASYWFYYICMRNLVLTSTSIDMNSLYSDVDFKQFIFIKATNYLGIVFSLGFFYPWARVRLAKFLAENTELNAMENLDNYTADESQDISATGSEVADYIDFDFGF